MKLVFLDTETTGLDPAKHQVFEVSWMVYDVNTGDLSPIRTLWLDHDLGNADFDALTINRYRERDIENMVKATPEDEEELFQVLFHNTLVGFNPRLDAAFLAARWDEEPWHCRLLDLGAWAAGRLDWVYPMGLHDTAKLVREQRQTFIPEPDHTSSGDVVASVAIWEALR